MMKVHDSVAVRTPSRSYQVVLGSGLLALSREYVHKLVERRRVFVITSSASPAALGQTFGALSPRPVQAGRPEMADYERFKRLATLGKLVESLIKVGADRSAIDRVGRGSGLRRHRICVRLHAWWMIQVRPRCWRKSMRYWRQDRVNLQSGKNLIEHFISREQLD
jgi:hypothetical protein